MGRIGKLFSGKSKEAVDGEIHVNPEEEKIQKLMARKREKQKEDREKAIGKIPSWVEEGKGFIYPEKLGEWEQCVKIRAEGVYHGTDLDIAIDIMKKIENGVPLEKAKQDLVAGLLGATDGILDIILKFSKKGADFYELATQDMEISPQQKRERSEAIERVRKENAKLKQLHMADNLGKETRTERSEEERKLLEKAEYKSRLEEELEDIEKKIMEFAKLRNELEEKIKGLEEDEK